MIIPDCQYVYKAKLIRVIDGDTFILAVDMGMKAFRHETIRLFGIDTPEKNPRKKGRSAESLKLERARAYSASNMAYKFLRHSKLLLRTHKDKQTFNRYIGEVWFQKSAGDPWFYLADELRKEGFEK